jgi:antitoxin ChpS
MLRSELDPRTVKAVEAFKVKLAQDFPVEQTILFGSRARNQHQDQSDADVAVVLQGISGPFIDTKLAMDDVAYEVLLDTGIRIQPLPIWRNEWVQPDQYTNPRLLANIRSEGFAL